MTKNSQFPFLKIATDAFGEAAIQALYSMGAVSLVQENATRKMDNTPDGDVTAIIHFTGHRDGYFSVSFSQSFVGNNFEKATKEETDDEADKSLEEEIGKFASRIAASARDQLQSQDYGIFPTSATVIHGKNESLPRTREGAPFLIPFRTGDGHIYLEIDF